jgi:hypothetical protein
VSRLGYFTHISGTKVDMLLAQIPHQPNKKIAAEIGFNIGVLSGKVGSEINTLESRVSRVLAVERPPSIIPTVGEHRRIVQHKHRSLARGDHEYRRPYALSRLCPTGGSSVRALLVRSNGAHATPGACSTDSAGPPTHRTGRPAPRRTRDRGAIDRRPAAGS